MEGSPYRERQRLLMCPRCRELLDIAVDGVRTCMRCEGLWLSPTTFTVAFGHPRGPVGTSAWWRNAIECPECAAEGRTTMLSARMCGEILVDTCQEHGLWLDRGELAQLLGTATDELERLRAQGLPVPDLADLLERREKWRSDGELRRRMTAEYQRLVEEEHQRREAILEQERLEAERAALEAPRIEEEPRIVVPAEPAAPPPPVPSADEHVQALLQEPIESAPPSESADPRERHAREAANLARRKAEEQARADEARRRAAARLEAERTAARIAEWNRERREAADRKRRESEVRVEIVASEEQRRRVSEEMDRRLGVVEAQRQRDAAARAAAIERNNRVTALHRAIAELETSRSSAEQRLQYLITERERVEGKITTLREQIEAAKAELASVPQDP